MNLVTDHGDAYCQQHFYGRLLDPDFHASQRQKANPMWGYQRRLNRDLTRWQEQGWVSAANADRIRADAANAPGVSLPGVLGILAAILLGFAVMSFVAAHWNEMPRLARLALLFSTMWAAYGAAGFFNTRGMNVFADAAILMAVSVFGASIMLISQMFHIDGNPPDGVLLWWVGSLLAGVALRSNPALALTLVLVCLWSFVWMDMHGGKTHWPFLIGWALAAAAFYWQQWRPGAHLSGLALSGFILTLGATLKGGHAFNLVTLIGLVTAAAAIFVEQKQPRFAVLARIVLGYAAVVAFAGLWVLQFIERTEAGELVVLGALSLLLLLALIWYGSSTHNRGALWLGYLGFSIEILALYGKTVGTLLDTSLFFLVAGLLVAGLAAMAWRLHARQTPEAVS